MDGVDVSDGLRRRVLTFLKEQRVMAVAVADRLGQPWVTPVLYANDGFDFYWMTSSRGRLAAVLAENSQAAATIVSDKGGLETLCGLQVEGTAGQVRGGVDRARAAEQYTRRFPELVSQVSLLEGRNVLEPGSGLSLFRLEARRCWFTDNSRGFGWQVEVAAAR